MNLRIAYMTGQYPRATDTFIRREVAALRARGVHVETLAVRRPPADEAGGPELDAERAGTHYLVPCSPFRLAWAHLDLLVRSPLRYLHSLITALIVRGPGLRRLIYQVFYFLEAGLVAHQMRRRRLAHLHNHFANSSCSVAMLAAQLGGFTFSFTIHGPAIFFEPAYWRLDAKVKRALFVCCISHFCRSQTMIWTPPEKWQRLHIVHCGVDPDLFTPTEPSDGRSNLLFVGRLAAVKGLPMLLQAVAELKRDRPAVQLTVVGEGPDRAPLEALASELEVADRVRFVGYQSSAEVRRQLAHTDVFVMASFAEGVPVVLMEAMAAEVPVVATRIAGVSELVEDGLSGYLVPPGDIQQLTERLAALLDDPLGRHRMGSAGRAKVERDFNLRVESDRLCRILTNALAGQTSLLRPHPAEQAGAAPAAPVSMVAYAKGSGP